MPTAEASQNTPLKRKNKKYKRTRASLKDFTKTPVSGQTDPRSHSPSPTEKKRPKIPGNTKTTKADIYELILTLELTMGKTEMAQRVPRTETIEKVIDEKHQIFKAGVATIILKKDKYSLPSERTVGMDAKDVELICKLFGLAK